MSDVGDRRRPPLNAADIARAAIALVDAEGPARLTMRRLGAALQVEAMALYRYFPSRRALLDGLVETVVSDVATDPGLQMVAGGDWQDYLHRLAHGIRQMALTHPRVFPLLATHPTEAPWIRPPIRSVRWVDAFLEGLQDHHFPPPAAADAYKQFSTFLLGHLLLEVSALGLDHDEAASAPPPPPDPDKQIAHHERELRADRAERLLSGDDTPDSADIVAGSTGRTRTVADEPAVQTAIDGVASLVSALPRVSDTSRRIGAVPDAVVVDADVPVVAALVSTASVELTGFPHVAALAGLLARDTSARDFDAGLGRLIDELAQLRRP